MSISLRVIVSSNNVEKPMKMLFAILITLAVLVSPVYAEPVLKRATRLPEIMINGTDGLSVDPIKLEAGQFYRLKITSDGRDEYLVHSMDGFFKTLFVDQVVINDLEVKTSTIWGLEYDDDGSIEIYFVPMRVGLFSIEARGLAMDGFKTVVVVE